MMTSYSLDDIEEVRCPVCREGGPPIAPPSPTVSELERIATDDTVAPASPIVIEDEPAQANLEDSGIDNVAQVQFEIVVISVR